MIHLKGAARDHPVFVEGGVPLDVPIESLAVTPLLSSQGAPKEGNIILLHYKTGSDKTWACSSSFQKQ